MAIILPVEKQKNAAMSAEQMRVVEAVSPKVTLTETEEGVEVKVRDVTGEHTATVLNGKDGADGSNYEITPADYQAIAEEVAQDAGFQQLEDAVEGMAYGTKDGSPVSSDSPYYENNAYYHSQQAAGSATAAGNAQTAAEAARDAAQLAAGDFQGLTFSVTGLAAGASPTVQESHSGGNYSVQLGIPKGDKGDKGDTGNPAPADQVTPAVNAYLQANFSNPSNPPLDRSLLSSSSAAPADMVGEIKSAINFADSMIGAKEIVFTSGGYIFTYYSAGTTVSLTPTSNANYAYAIMDCVAGDKIHINGEGAGNAYLWSFIDSSDKMIEKSTEGLTGTDLVVIAPENSAKVILNSKLSSLGLCFKGSIIKNDVAELQTTVRGIKSQHLLQQSDLALANSNFVVKDGLAYAVSVTSPYNCMAINAKEINFKYRRRSSTNSFYVGVCIDGKFVGNRTNAVVTEIKTLYNTTNNVYANAVVNKSVADDSYSTDYNDYTATLTGQVFELKKGQTTILKFTVADGVSIQGIAFLNYYFQYYGTADNTDFKNGIVVIDEIKEKNTLTEEKISDVDIIGNEVGHRMVAGVIRNSGDGWEFIVNNNHQGDLNCESVGIANNDGRLYVDYSGINVKKVISCIFAPDEEFANQGYIMGASVGKTAAYIQIYQYRMSSVSARITFQNSGGTISPTISESDGVSAAVWDDTNKALSITHSNIVTKTASTAPIINFVPAVYGKYLMRLYSYSGTTVKVEFFDLVTGNKVTTPDTSMSLIFSRVGSALERIEVDPSTLVSPNGNIWFIGIFEV